MTIIPNAPPNAAISRKNGISLTTPGRFNGIPVTIPNARIPNISTRDTAVSPTIFPIIIAYRDMGAINISWAKSFCLSSTRDIIPEAVD